MKTNLLPKLNRSEFYRLREGDLIAAAVNAIEAHLAEGGKIRGEHKALIAWCRLAFDLPNGGLTQFFFNNRGTAGIREMLKLLEVIGLPAAVPTLCEAVAVYQEHSQAFRVANPWDGLFASMAESKIFDSTERRVFRYLLRGSRGIEAWFRTNIRKVMADECGCEIDPLFTGTVEILHPNGTIAESLTVRKGKPHGRHAMFFPDGSVKKTTYYKNGKVSGDYWPNGQIKRRESKKADGTVFEWFFPDGSLQKRLRTMRSGFIDGPVRRYHENGQLAEEMHYSREKKRGPWRKFFSDGSPQLDAEYAARETLIIHNAWDDDRKQTVKNGNGIFREDGLAIDWEYDLYRQTDWIHERTLQRGLPNGITTVYYNQAVWCIVHYRNGVLHGESISYYDNGRISSRSDYKNGKEVRCKYYAKFDRHTPAVLLILEADAKLYADWDHMPVDRYPAAINREEIEKRLPMPDFLREVDDRNRNKNLREDYEDWNTFNDGIWYELTVNTNGIVKIVKANGSGVYSGGSWNDYKPYLELLRFEPAQLRGEAVECRVLARVIHTFVEGA